MHGIIKQGVGVEGVMVFLFDKGKGDYALHTPPSGQRLGRGADLQSITIERPEKVNHVNHATLARMSSGLVCFCYLLGSMKC